MSTLKEILSNDLKVAMKDKNTTEINAIRQIKASITEEETRGTAHEVDDPTVVKIIQKLIKQHEDSSTQYRNAGRTELADVEDRERWTMEKYVPKTLTEEELRTAISKMDCGNVGEFMKELNSRYPGRVDGRLASTIIREVLTKSN